MVSSPPHDELPTVTVVVQDWQPQQASKGQAAPSASKDPAAVVTPGPQEEEAQPGGALCRAAAAVARIFNTPECWGRPDDKVGAGRPPDTTPTHRHTMLTLPCAACVISYNQVPTLTQTCAVC